MEQPSRAVLVATGAAGVVGAAALPLWSVGIGWPVTAVAIAVVAAVARRDRIARCVDNGGAAGEHWSDRAWRIAAALAAFALVSVAAWRAAPWLVALCLGTGTALGSYAVIGGRSWGALARAALTLVPASSLGVGWLIARRDTRANAALLPRVLGGLFAGVVLLLIFGSLFVAADSAFADLLQSYRDHISVTVIARVLVGLAVTLLVAAAVAYRMSVGRPTEPVHPAGPRRLGLVEWGIALAMLDVLFGLFVFVQITVLFGGSDYVLRPGGPDYAAYARGGFLQLMTVTGLTLAVVGALAAFARRETRAQRWSLRILVGVLCLLTLVVVSSALKRLGLYAGAYGFTMQRLLGYAGEVWLGLVFALVIVAGVRLKGSWLPRGMVAVAVGTLIALAAINPEALMARTHIARLDQNYGLDWAFLTSLSADAVDEVAALQRRDGAPCYIGAVQQDLAGTDAWYAWNLSRQHARARLQTHDWSHVCPVSRPAGHERPG